MDMNKSFFRKSMRVLAYAKPHWKLLSLVFTLSVVASLLPLANPYLIKLLVDDVFMGGDMQLFILILIVFLVAFFLSSVIGLVLSYKSQALTEGITLDVKRKLFRHIERLDIGFFSSKETGDVLTRVLDDVYGIQAFIGMVYDSILINLITGIAILFICLQFSWTVTLLALGIFFPCFVFVQRRYSKKIASQEKQIRVQDAKLVSFVGESKMEMSTVQEFTRESATGRDFLKKQRKFIGLTIERSFLQGLSDFEITVIAFTPLFFIILFGGYSVLQGAMTVGILMALYMYIQQLLGPVSVLGSTSIELRKIMVSVDRVFEYLDTKPKITEKKNARVLRRAKGNIEFKDVSFGYKPDNLILDKINFKIRAGQKIGIVGPSGSGKTTLAERLICRFIDPISGEILLDGHDLRDLKINSLRKNIGVVNQEDLLFNASIKDNIRFGKLDATDKEIIRAAELANVDEFVERLPKGYDTIVGELGTKLSGGQRQRVAIARVILKDPRIIVLDEATSSLDPKSEKKIHEALDRVTKGRTALIITHRLSSVKNVDKILVLKDEKIVEEGSFSDLMSNRGVFCDLYNAQFGKFQNFQDMLKEELERARISKIPLTLAVIHVRNFEALVKGYRKTKSEKMSERIFSLLKSYTRKSDFVAKNPSVKNIFYVLMPETDKEDAKKILNMTLDTIKNKTITKLNVSCELLSKPEIRAQMRHLIRGW